MCSPPPRNGSIYIFMISALLVMGALVGPAAAEPRELPFAPGEKLTFDLRWKFISAGTASLEVLPMTEISGAAAHHFLLTVRTSAWVDVFYKVRDRIEGFADAAMTRSLGYKKEQREGSYIRDVNVTLDWEKETAQYETKKRKREPIFIYPGTLDPLSACYYFRLQNLAVGAELQAPICDGKKVVIGRVRVIKQEAVKVPAGKFDTFLVEPELKHLGGVFKRSKAASLKVWVSADGRCLPVKVKSKVMIGNFLAELVSIEMAP